MSIPMNIPLSVDGGVSIHDSPSTSQSSGALSSVPDISAFNLFYIEVCWSTGYTSHRAGTWVYVPEGSSVIAHPSV